MTGGLAAQSAATASRYNPVLDGLRALAVVAVIGDHAGFHSHGFHGVTVFFVLSGYLITSLLIHECDRSGTVSFRRFYWRRFARLAPALVVVVIATVGYLVVVGRSPATYWAGPVGALTSSMDLIQAISGNTAVGIHFQWSWSLGIEEQFYLLWPIGLLLLWRRHRGLIAPLLLVLVAGAWVLRALELATNASHESVFFGPVSHYDALVLGVLIAVFRARYTPGRAGDVVIGIGGALGAVGLLVLEFRLPTIPGLDAIDPDAFGQAAVFATGVVLWASGSTGRAARLVLGSRPLAFLGRLSYGLYLWNILTIVAFVRLTGFHPAQTRWGIVWGAALLALCTASYLLVERPLRRRWGSPAFLRRGRQADDVGLPRTAQGPSGHLT
ncbi:MAG: acyltransferase [Acidobacteria bacterium]|nr:acyltransferase [Acidobacteriota bacterium]